VNSGNLMIIGGAEEKSHSGGVLSRFMKLSIRRDPVVLFIDAASRSPGRMAEEYRRIFLDMGAGDVLYPRLARPTDASNPRFIEAVKCADLIFLSGGDQNRLSRILRRSLGLERMLDRYRNDGLSVGGTSAGAAALSARMIAGGDGGLWPKKGRVRIADGLGFVPRIIVDQHFAQRWRFGRLVEAIAIHARDGITGIGVDEDTAVLIKNDGTAEIIGSGGVALIRCAYRAYSNWNRASRGELIPVPLKIFRILTSGELISSLN